MLNGIDSSSRNMINTWNQSQKTRETASAQLSSGNKLAKPSVSPADLGISMKMLAQIFGSDQASRNVQDGMSMLQTAEGALSGISDMTMRINELTVQAANGIYTDEQRGMMQDEVDQMVSEINSTAGRAEFNKMKLLDGSKSEANGGVWIQSGANAGDGTKMDINRIMSDTLGLDGYNFAGKSGRETSKMLGKSPSAMDSAGPAFGTALYAMETVTAERAKIGAQMNAMEFTENALDVASENMSAANSRIADADMAKSMMANTREQLKQQVSISMLGNLFKNQQTMRDLLFASLNVGARA